MRITAVVGGVAALLIAFSVLSWVTGSGGSTDQASQPAAANQDPTKPNEDGIFTVNPFTIAQEGPHPKIEVESLKYNFDRIAVGATDRHEFAIKNVGDAPLKLATGPRTCKCTIGKLATEEIAPGESATIEMEWHPLAQSEMFMQTATIWTNDPLQPKLDFEVEGMVVPTFITMPEGTWTVGMLAEGTPSNVTGRVMSMLSDEFEITSIETSAPYVTATHRPLTEDELKAGRAFGGYEITCQVQPEMPVGQFNEEVILKTNVEDAPEFKFTIQGTRMGPFNIVGTGWFQAQQLLEMGRFTAAEGKTVRLSVFVIGADGSLEFAEPQVEPPVLNVSLKRDESFGGAGGRQRFLVTIEAPAGITPGRWSGDSAVQVTLNSNHPEAPTARFSVSLQAD